MNQYIVMRNQQTAVEANDPDDALKKFLAGEGTQIGSSYNIQIRPPQPRTTPNAPAPTPNP